MTVPRLQGSASLPAGQKEAHSRTRGTAGLDAGLVCRSGAGLMLALLLQARLCVGRHFSDPSCVLNTTCLAVEHSSTIDYGDY